MLKGCLQKSKVLVQQRTCGLLYPERAACHGSACILLATTVHMHHFAFQQQQVFPVTMDSTEKQDFENCYFIAVFELRQNYFAKMEDKAD